MLHSPAQHNTHNTAITTTNVPIRRSPHPLDEPDHPSRYARIRRKWRPGRLLIRYGREPKWRHGIIKGFIVVSVRTVTTTSHASSKVNQGNRISNPYIPSTSPVPRNKHHRIGEYGLLETAKETDLFLAENTLLTHNDTTAATYTVDPATTSRSSTQKGNATATTDYTGDFVSIHRSSTDEGNSTADYTGDAATFRRSLTHLGNAAVNHVVHTSATRSLSTHFQTVKAKRKAETNFVTSRTSTPTALTLWSKKDPTDTSVIATRSLPANVFGDRRQNIAPDGVDHGDVNDYEDNDDAKCEDNKDLNDYYAGRDSSNDNDHGEDDEDVDNDDEFDEERIVYDNY